MLLLCVIIFCLFVLFVVVFCLCVALKVCVYGLLRMMAKDETTQMNTHEKTKQHKQTHDQPKTQTNATKHVFVVCSRSDPFAQQQQTYDQPKTENNNNKNMCLLCVIGLFVCLFVWFVCLLVSFVCFVCFGVWCLCVVLGCLG